MPKKIVQVQHLNLAYRGIQAVQDVSFAVEAGEILAVIGQNGSGKTSTVESIEGLRKPDSGQIQVFGQDPWLHRRQVYGKMGAFPLTLAEYKEKKIYKRFDASPAGKGRIIEGQIAVNMIMTLAGIFVLLVAGTLLFHIKIRGNALAILAATLLSVAAMYSMGFLFTALGRDTKITNLLCYLFYFVMIFLSGATMPRASFPQSMMTISNLLPMTWAVNLVQKVYVGQAFFQQGTDILLLLLVTVICTAAGGLLYRKKDWA